MHFAQALTLAPKRNPNFAAVSADKRSHCRLGFCVRLIVGLYFPLSFTSRQARFLIFPQIAHRCAMNQNGVRFMATLNRVPLRGTLVQGSHTYSVIICIL